MQSGVTFVNVFNFFNVFAMSYGTRKWLKTVFKQSSEHLVALETVLRWLETVLRWLKTVLKWLKEVLNMDI